MKKPKVKTGITIDWMDKSIQTLYMVVMNLSGVHEIVYEMKLDNDGMWIGNDGDECFYSNEKRLGWNEEDGRAEFITRDKDEAKNVLYAILTYRTHLKSHL